jgi:hypothetical protein
MKEHRCPLCLWGRRIRIKSSLELQEHECRADTTYRSFNRPDQMALENEAFGAQKIPELG